jgi:hypothetical protein
MVDHVLLFCLSVFMDIVEFLTLLNRAEINSQINTAFLNRILKNGYTIVIVFNL